MYLQSGVIFVVTFIISTNVIFTNSQDVRCIQSIGCAKAQSDYFDNFGSVTEEEQKEKCTHLAPALACFDGLDLATCPVQVIIDLFEPFKPLCAQLLATAAPPKENCTEMETSSCLLKGAITLINDMTTPTMASKESTTCRGLRNAADCLDKPEHDDIHKYLTDMSRNCTDTGISDVQYAGCDSLHTCLNNFVPFFDPSKSPANVSQICSKWNELNECGLNSASTFCPAQEKGIYPALAAACANPCEKPDNTTIVYDIEIDLVWLDIYADMTATATLEIKADFETWLRSIFVGETGFVSVTVIRFLNIAGKVYVEFEVEYNIYLELSVQSTISASLAFTVNTTSMNTIILTSGTVVNVVGIPRFFYRGRFFTVRDECFLYDQSGLCENGGRCYIEKFAPVCLCSIDYEGKFCQIALPSVVEVYMIIDLAWQAGYNDLDSVASLAIKNDLEAQFEAKLAAQFAGYQSFILTKLVEVNGKVKVYIEITYEYYLEVNVKAEIAVLMLEIIKDRGGISIDGDMTPLIGPLKFVIQIIGGRKSIEITGPCFLYDDENTCGEFGVCVPENDLIPHCSCQSPFVGEFCDKEYICKGIEQEESLCLAQGVATLLRDIEKETNASRITTTCSKLHDTYECLEFAENEKVEIKAEFFGEYTDMCTDKGVPEDKFEGCMDKKDCFNAFGQIYTSDDKNAICLAWTTLQTCIGGATVDCEAYNVSKHAMELACGQDICPVEVPAVTTLEFTIEFVINETCTEAFWETEAGIDQLDALKEFIKENLKVERDFRNVLIKKPRCGGGDFEVIIEFEVIFEVVIDVTIQSEISINLAGLVFGSKGNLVNLGTFSWVVGRELEIILRRSGGFIVTIDLKDPCDVFLDLGDCGLGRCQVSAARLPVCVCPVGVTGLYCDELLPTSMQFEIVIDFSWAAGFLDLNSDAARAIIADFVAQVEAIFRSRFDGFRQCNVTALIDVDGKVQFNFDVQFDIFVDVQIVTELVLTLEFEFKIQGGITIGGIIRGILGNLKFLIGQGNMTSTVNVTGVCFLYDQQDLCKNSGVCQEMDKKPHCMCQDGYTGEFCEDEEVARPECNENLDVTLILDSSGSITKKKKVPTATLR